MRAHWAPMQDRVYAVLLGGYPMSYTIREIANSADIGYRQAESAVQKLAQKEKIERAGVDSITGATTWRLS